MVKKRPSQARITVSSDLGLILRLKINPKTLIYPNIALESFPVLQGVNILEGHLVTPRNGLDIEFNVFIAILVNFCF